VFFQLGPGKKSKNHQTGGKGEKKKEGTKLVKGNKMGKKLVHDQKKKWSIRRPDVETPKTKNRTRVKRAVGRRVGVGTAGGIKE